MPEHSEKPENVDEPLEKSEVSGESREASENPAVSGKSEKPREASENPDPPRGKAEPPRGKAEPPRGKTEPPRGKTEPPRGKTEPPRGKAEPPRGKAEPPRGKIEPPRRKPEKSEKPRQKPEKTATPEKFRTLRARLRKLSSYAGPAGVSLVLIIWLMGYRTDSAHAATQLIRLSDAAFAYYDTRQAWPEVLDDLVPDYLEPEDLKGPNGEDVSWDQETHRITVPCDYPGVGLLAWLDDLLGTYYSPAEGQSASLRITPERPPGPRKAL